MLYKVLKFWKLCVKQIFISEIFWWNHMDNFANLNLYYNIKHLT